MVGNSCASDSTEQQDSESDTSASWIELTGVHGCSGLWSLEALAHLFTKEVGGGVEDLPTSSSSWLLDSTKGRCDGLSVCLAELLVVRPVEGVACGQEENTEKLQIKGYTAILVEWSRD